MNIVVGAPDFSLSGRLALVTGSTQGLGFAIAQAYAASGATVIINGRDAQRVDRAVQTLTQQGHAAHPLVMDIGQLQSQENTFNQICAEIGTPDILVNNVWHTHSQDFGQRYAG